MFIWTVPSSIIEKKIDFRGLSGRQILRMDLVVRCIYLQKRFTSKAKNLGGALFQMIVGTAWVLITIQQSSQVWNEIISFFRFIYRHLKVKNQAIIRVRDGLKPAFWKIHIKYATIRPSVLSVIDTIDNTESASSHSYTS